MSDKQPESPFVAQAKVRRSNALLLTAWLIPLLAVLTGAWLFMQHVRDTGPEITLYMPDAEGIEVDNTVIKVRNLQVGRVTGIRLLPDGQGVAVSALLSADAEDMMRSDTRFWIVKPQIGQSGVSGLGTLLSGPYLAFVPGQSEERANEFQVADFPPATAFGEGGLWLKLTGSSDKMITQGSPVTYRGITVGSVENATFQADRKTVDYQIYIRSPNEQLISPNSRFWMQSGLHAELGGQGLKIDTPSLPALISGSIAFETPEDAAASQAVAADTHFTLYDNRHQAQNSEDARSLYYVVFFRQSVRGLSVGAPVEYKGIPIGSVSDLPYFDHNHSLELLEKGHIPVRLRIDPSRLEINADAQSQEAWRNRIQNALNRGVSATLASNNLITGSLFVELADPIQGQTVFRPENQYRGDTVIASRNGSGLGDLQQQVSTLLDKINRLPLEQTVQGVNASLAELQATLAHTKRLLGQNETQRLPEELNRSLQQLQSTLSGLSPDSPVYQDVQQTLQSIDRTLREATPVLNTLKEQPNALIFNSSSTDPIPKGTH